jgi:hypothetical protein
VKSNCVSGLATNRLPPHRMEPLRLLPIEYGHSKSLTFTILRADYNRPVIDCWRTCASEASLYATVPSERLQLAVDHCSEPFEDAPVQQVGTR